MRPPPWMLLRLGIETAVHHAQADEDRLSALNIKTVDAYRSFLLGVFGFETAAEHAIVGLVGIDAPLFKGRLRSMRLREDLLALGMTDFDLERAPRATVSVGSAADGLGWMFVLERQTLLSGIVRRHLHHVLRDPIRVSSSYLAAPGESPGARFRAFGEAVGALANRYRPASIVEGANDAFRAQRNWYARAKDSLIPDVAPLAAIA